MPHSAISPHSSDPQFTTAAEVMAAAFLRYGRPAPSPEWAIDLPKRGEMLLTIGSVRRYYMHDDMQALLDELVFSGAILQRRSPNA